MNISIETISGLERRLTISLPSESFEDRISTRLNDTRGRVRLPGFRPGKVPLKEVRRRYGPAIRAEVAGELMQSSFVDAVRQEDLAPAGSPNLEVVKMEPGVDFEFTATFEVFPVFDVVDLKQVELTKPHAEITDDDLEEMIERLRMQRQTWCAVERGAQDGDRATVDFVGTIDGEPFEGGEGEGVQFVLGAGQMIEDFDRGVAGRTAGSEAVIEVSFPDDYNAEQLQGKSAQFALKVVTIEEPELPDLDDAFFAEFGVEEGGEEAFREEVRSNMTRELENAVSEQMKKQVVQQLTSLHDFALPHSLVHREIHNLQEQMREQFRSYGAQNVPDLGHDMFEPQAKDRVRAGLIINKIVEDGELAADPDAVRQRIEKMAEAYADPQQVVAYYYGNPEQLEQIEMAVLEDRVVQHVTEHATVNVLESSYADIIGGRALPAEEPAPDAADDAPETAEASADSGDAPSDAGTHASTPE